jgi:hypothetical protein
VAGVLIEESSWDKAKRLLGRIETSQILDPGYIERVVLKVMPRFQGGTASFRYFWPPSGGIPAATSTSSTLAVGSALCYVAIQGTTGNYTKGTTTERVENEVSTIVGASGKPIGCVRNSYGSWTVVVEDCGASTSTDGGTTPQPDVGENSSSSRSIDMGYSLGV